MLHHVDLLYVVLFCFYIVYFALRCPVLFYIDLLRFALLCFTLFYFALRVALLATTSEGKGRPGACKGGWGFVELKAS